MATTPLTSNTAHGEHHITPPSEYWKVLGALTVLMILTVYVAVKIQVPDIGPIPGVWLNNLIAIFIAVAKAMLVIWVFMGVKHASALTRIWVAAGFICFATMYFISADHLTRRFEQVPGWQEKEGSALPRVFDPLGERGVPPADEMNVRPRQ
ncbi:MAG TPA: cytochrome C oxidase subunit IV family protein [Fimbriimonas sp.]|nr:cytochrome C oxidase subunit IV family protein [Fimbriimonas sp.]